MPARDATTLSHNGVAGFVFAPQWLWVHYPDPGLVGDDLGDNPAYHGFAIEVLASLNGHKEREHAVALRAFLDTINTPAVSRDELDAAEDAYLRAIAWRCRAWNWQEVTADGDTVTVLAPGACIEEDAHLAFFVLPPDLRSWVVRAIRQAPLPKATTRSSPSVTPMAPPTRRTKPPEPAPPPS